MVAPVFRFRNISPPFSPFLADFLSKMRNLYLHSINIFYILVFCEV